MGQTGGNGQIKQTKLQMTDEMICDLKVLLCASSLHIRWPMIRNDKMFNKGVRYIVKMLGTNEKCKN